MQFFLMRMLANSQQSANWKGEAMKTYYTCKEVMERLGVCQTKAYQVIRELNKELQDKGYITVQGKVSKKYFEERIY